MNSLRIIDACTEKHFAAMSRIHARGWHAAYSGHVPDDYLRDVITEDHWIPFFREDYRGWGEIISFYTDPACTGRGYGSVLMEEALRRLRADGYPSCYVFVLRENEGARRFYARHGFAWDGTEEHIPFPHDMTCVDLRYTKQL